MSEVTELGAGFKIDVELHTGTKGAGSIKKEEKQKQEKRKKSLSGRSPTKAHFTQAFGAAFRKNPEIFVKDPKSPESKKAVDEQLQIIGYGKNKGLVVHNAYIDSAIETWFQNNPEDKKLALYWMMKLQEKASPKVEQATRSKDVSKCKEAMQKVDEFLISIPKARKKGRQIKERYIKDPTNVKKRRELGVAKGLLEIGEKLFSYNIGIMQKCGGQRPKVAKAKKVLSYLRKSIRNYEKALKEGSNCEAVITAASRQPKQVDEVALMLTEAGIRYKKSKSKSAKKNLQGLINKAKPIIKTMNQLAGNCDKCNKPKLAKKIKKKVNNLKEVIKKSNKILATPVKEKTVVVKKKEKLPSPSKVPEKEISPFSPYEPPEIIAPPIEIEPEQIILKTRKRNVSIMVVAAATVPWVLALV